MDFITPVALEGVGLFGVLVWLVLAIVRGWIVSGAEARRMLDASERTIERQSQVIEGLLGMAGLVTNLTEALPDAEQEQP